MNVFTLFMLLASVADCAVPTALNERHECSHKHGEVQKGLKSGPGFEAGSDAASLAAAPSLDTVVALDSGRGGEANTDSGRGKWKSSRVSQTGSRTGALLSPSHSAHTSLVDEGTSPSDEADAVPVRVVTAKDDPLLSSITKPAPSPSSSAAAAPPTGGGNTPRSKPGGLAINEQSVRSFSGFLKGNLGWYTGWAATPLPGTDGLEWVPQVWGVPQVTDIKEESAKWPSSVSIVLSFNERESWICSLFAVVKSPRKSGF